MLKVHPQKDSKATADSIIRPLSRRFLAVLLCVSALLLLDQVILQPLLMQLRFSAPAINLAGRQRMLSQKITKEALALQLSVDRQSKESHDQQLTQALNQWSDAHRLLLHGDPDRGISPAVGAIAQSFKDIEPTFSKMQAEARGILGSDTSSNLDSTAKSTVRLLELEPVYLAGMEEVVAQLERSTNQRVSVLRLGAILAALAILVLLIALYRRVLRPVAQVIHQQVEQLATSEQEHRQLAELLRQSRDTLELRVTQRTSELMTANSALTHEINERQAAELRMRALSNQLAHASRITALGQLATGLAHEINQPLATISNYAGLMQLSWDQHSVGDTQTREHLKQIKDAALRAGAIVRRMRNFVRGGEVLSIPVDLNVLAQEVLELCDPEMRNADVQLALELSREPVYVSADPVQIQQVLVNLIHNAIQAMTRTSIKNRTLLLSTCVDDDGVTLSVSDTGPGLSAGAMEECFEPFHTSKPEGLGLGLAISRNIVEQHQGRIWSANREDGGAIVSFNLPRLNIHDKFTEQHTDCLCR